MTEEHDEALIERVAQHLFDKEMGYSYPVKDAKDGARFMKEARRIIYPPAPPKTRLQVSADIWREAGGKGQLIHDTVAGKAILAALALPAMED